MAFGTQGDVLERTEHSVLPGQGPQRVLEIWSWVSPGLCPPCAAYTHADASSEPEYTALSEGEHEVGVEWAKSTPKRWWVGEDMEGDTTIAQV